MEILEALAWLDRRIDHESGSLGVAAGRIDGLSLEPMFDLMSLLGDPQREVPVIHITGTNGKGTVTEMVASLIAGHGLTAGTYTSPHVDRLNERLRHDGRPISDDELAEVLTGIAAVEPLLEVVPTWFEVLTAAAFRWFAEAPVDVAVVEVGLLGRFDATNVAEAQVAVITSIGADHTDFAPGWQEAIASEKAGIIGPDSVAVLGPMSDELVAVVNSEGPAGLVRYGVDVEVVADSVAVGGHAFDVSTRRGSYSELYLPMHGTHQVVNAAIAIATVEEFFDRALPEDVVREALGGVSVPGRFEVLHHGPLVVLDGAHNPDALEAAARTIDEEFTHAGSRLVVLGLLAGRDADASIAAISAARPDLVVCTQLSGDRAMPAAELATACARAGVAHELVLDPRAAVARALAVSAEEDSVLVTGSFRLLSDARAVVAAATTPDPEG